MIEPTTSAALIAGGATIASGAISSAANWASSNKQMRFQERMSNTAHQREIRDLKAAGLNPILSAKLGGSSSPPGSSAQAHIPDVGQSATAAMAARSQVALNEAQIEDINAAAQLKGEQQADLAMTRGARIDQLLAASYQAIQSGKLSKEQIPQVQQNIKNLEAQRELVSSQTAHSAATLEKEQVKSKLWTEPNKLLDKVKGRSFWDKSKDAFNKKFNRKKPKKGATGRW